MLFFLHYTLHQIIVIIVNSEFYLSEYKQNGKLVSVVRQRRRSLTDLRHQQPSMPSINQRYTMYSTHPRFHPLVVHKCQQLQYTIQ